VPRASPVSDQEGRTERPTPDDRGGAFRVRSDVSRREFLRRAGARVGSLAAVGALGRILTGCDESVTGPPYVPGPNPEVVVVGAGAFGGWTAFHLQAMGARVTLVDRHGPGNPLSSSGDATRGIRSAYGSRTLWTRWANRAMDRWRSFDEEWSPVLDEATGGRPLFHSAGDLILRPSWTSFLQETRDTFDELAIPYEILTPAQVEDRWPWIRTQGMGAALFEPGAGVARARSACRVVAEALVRTGGELRVARAEPGGTGSGDRLREVELSPGGAREAEVFVFALGPWFPTELPALMGHRLGVPLGHVYYFDPPEGDDRFLHPSMPSWNAPGVTGWPSLPAEPAGFRVRVGGHQGGTDPSTSNRAVPPSAMDEPRQILAERFPDLVDAPLLLATACHYELTARRSWIVDRHPRWSNVWIVGGGNAEGFKFGPVLGEYVAARVLGHDPEPGLADELRL
jgi:sarcosine oxidase